MKKLKILNIFLLLPVVVAAQKTAALETLEKDEVVSMIERVNDHWQTTHPTPANPFWHPAAYHTGNIEAYRVTGHNRYREYSEQWAVHNQWKGARSDDRADWKHDYGETDDHVLFGDWQICFQTYIDLYDMDPDPVKIARAKEVMEYQMSTGKNYYWWWADGLYMVMPVMTKLYKLTGEERYLEKLNEWLSFADSIMWDKKAKLYYRDGKYVYPKHKSANGKKDFWARGDGWVFAGLAKVLQDLPADHRSRPMFEKRFRDMAGAIAACQQPGGYWTRSMLDPAHAPGQETSGTAFFTYGMLWGINNGLLDARKYLPVAARGWEYLSTKALQEDGAVGYVQPIGEKAIPGQVVGASSTADFGVGAFLLAACELTRWIDARDGWELVWQDEFERDGAPGDEWSTERGFTRNRELQWYQAENSQCRDGLLVIEARREDVKNPGYKPGSSDWKQEREYARYTSGSIKTRGEKEFQYGRFEIRAKIPTAGGSWPAIWTLGTEMPWPSCGEIDIMEYYRIKGVPHILANTAWGKDTPNNAEWDSATVPFQEFLNDDPAWADKFHLWRMDWDEDFIRIYLDGRLMNETDLSKTYNGTLGGGANPFRQPHYLLLNLAIGGQNGGEPDAKAFPMKYEVDFVRVFQKVPPGTRK